jgi:PPE-repeat protein
VVFYPALPPETNAFRLTMMGAGPAAHVPAAAAFEAASVTHAEGAVQITNTAVSTASTYMGAGSIAMVQSALEHGAWMSTAAIMAQRTATTVESGMGLYGTAVASTVPFGVVVSNRVRGATLQATNILGVNTIPIAENEAEYVEYWGQNASAMTAYLAGITSLVSALAIPLPLIPGVANPAEAVAAGVTASAMSLGLQGATTALSSATQATATSVTAASAAVSTGTTGATSGAPATAQSGQTASPGMLGAPPPTASPSAPGSAPNDAGQLMQTAQTMMGPMMQAPQAVMSGAPQLLSQAGQIPSSMAGQVSGLLSPAMPGATGGFGGSGAPGVGIPGLTTAGGWSGLGAANGGYAGGGSTVAASLTKPSALAGSNAMAGPAGVPQKWWNATGSEDAKPMVAGPRGGTATTSAGGAPMGGTGMMGMPAGGSSGRRTRDDVTEADQTVLTDEGFGDGVPVYTDDGGVVYVGGQEV